MTFKVIADHKGQVFMAACGRRLRGSMQAGNAKCAEILLDGIIESIKTTFKTHSVGGLADSWSIIASKNGAEIVSSKVYAGIHERGGIIRAKNKPFLHFQYRKGDPKTWVRVKQVNMPARRYISNGIEAKRDRIEAFTKDFLVTVIRQAAQQASSAKPMVSQWGKKP